MVRLLNNWCSLFSLSVSLFSLERCAIMSSFVNLTKRSRFSGEWTARVRHVWCCRTRVGMSSSAKQRDKGSASLSWSESDGDSPSLSPSPSPSSPSSSFSSIFIVQSFLLASECGRSDNEVSPLALFTV